MRHTKPVLAIVGTLCACSTVRADEWDQTLETLASESSVVVLGRVARVGSIARTNGKTVSLGTIEVRQYLKGVSDAKVLECERRSDFNVELRPDTEDVIWFVRKELSTGRYLVVGNWSRDCLGRILATIARVDKNSRLVGMPKPQRGSAPISVVLACHEASGRAATRIRFAAGAQVELVAQFENHDSSPNAVMPQLDGSDVHWRYPYYDLEVRDSAGQSLRFLAGGRCGNTDALHTQDIVLLQRGEVLKVWLQPDHRLLEPGTYRVRLRYTAKQDPSSKGLLGANDADVPQKIKTVWEGTIESNWVDIEITPGSGDCRP